MKTPYQSIYEVLKLNRFIVLGVCAFAFFSTGFSLWMAYHAHRKMLNSVFAVNTDGTVIPLTLTDQRAHLEVEAQAHLDLFHRFFYGLNTSNYEENIEKALWLGDSSVDDVYRQKKSEGVYNRLLQYSLVQSVTKVTSEVTLSGEREPLDFRTTTLFEVKRGAVTDRYELITTGELIRVERNFPRNTHGFLITGFFENSLKKTSDEN